MTNSKSRKWGRKSNGTENNAKELFTPLKPCSIYIHRPP